MLLEAIKFLRNFLTKAQLSKDVDIKNYKINFINIILLFVLQSQRDSLIYAENDVQIRSNLYKYAPGTFSFTEYHQLLKKSTTQQLEKELDVHMHQKEMQKHKAPLSDDDSDDFDLMVDNIKEGDSEQKGNDVDDDDDDDDDFEDNQVYKLVADNYESDCESVD